MHKVLKNYLKETFMGLRLNSRDNENNWPVKQKSKRHE